jgi:hypothetical protein
MTHSRGMGRSGAVTVVSVLALGLTGVGHAGTAHHVIVAKVTVTLTDTKLVLSRPGIQAGTAMFVVVNKGQKFHVLAITGPGLKGVRTPKLAAGKSATLTVKLRTGAYMLSDPVGLGFLKTSWLVVNPSSAVSSGPNSARPNGPAGNAPSGGTSGQNGGGLDGSMACDI